MGEANYDVTTTNRTETRVGEANNYVTTTNRTETWVREAKYDVTTTSRAETWAEGEGETRWGYYDVHNTSIAKT